MLLTQTVNSQPDRRSSSRHLADAGLRARMAEIEGRLSISPSSPTDSRFQFRPSAPAALLRAQLAELVSKREAARAGGSSRSPPYARRALMGAAVLVAAVVAGSWSTIPPAWSKLNRCRIRTRRTSDRSLTQAQHGELLSATFVRWLTSKSSERYQCLCARSLREYVS